MNETKRKFLIADDNMVNRSLMGHLLKPFGECSVAVDGFEAVAQVKETSQKGQSFDLIFLDVMMPQQDGFEALKEIRAFESEQQLTPAKVVMVSALKGQEQIDRSLACGAQRYLLKPIREQEIFSLLSGFGITESPELSAP